MPIGQHASAYVRCVKYVSIRQHTSAYVSIRQRGMEREREREREIEKEPYAGPVS